ncbi:MAG: ABC transporter permease [Candidatus Cyclobacteriaceae bacterium M2_1C_046]
MIKNYLKTAWRSLKSSKIFTSIKILGLALGIIISVPIFLIIQDELAFDNFHHKKDRIYRAWVDEEYGDGIDYLSTVTPKKLGSALKNNIPEVEAFTRLEDFQDYIEHGNELFSERFTLVDPVFFNIFDFEIRSGSTNKIFQDNYEIVLSADASEKYFGNDNPIGKTLKIRLTDGFEEFKVVAVLENPPFNSSINYDILMPFENIRKRVSENSMQSWFSISCETYVLLNEYADVSSAESKFAGMLKNEIGENYTPGSYVVGLQPLTDIHLNTDLPAGIAPVSDPKYSVILGAIAILVLLLGGINFMTLALGKSLSRSKEVGVRKVVGASKSQIRNQFLGEAFLSTFIAVVMSICLLPLLLPKFQELSGRELDLNPTFLNIIFIIILLLILTLFSGSYPALIVSKMKPALIVKGSTKSGVGKQNLLRWLIGAQLVLSLFLISCTLIMKNQLNFLQEKNLGFDSDQVAVVNINTSNSISMTASFEKAQLLKNELEKESAIKNLAFAAQNFNGAPWISVSFPDAKSTTHSFSFNVVSPEFIPMMDIPIIEGQNFSGWEGQNKNSIIVNESFAKHFGWEDPIGKSIPGPQFPPHEVIGVVKDFHFMSLHNEIQPLALVINPTIIFSGVNNVSVNQSTSPKAFIELHGGQVANGIETIKAAWEKVYPSEPFAFSFLDETLQRQYEEEQQLGEIVTGAAILAIVIAGMGLFGLSSLIINRRTREIGIRKVLGAETADITFMFTKEFLLISFTALILAIPLCLYVMQNWLQEFQYKVDVNAGVFLLTGVLAILVCLITVTTQSFRAALQNPVDTIGSE